MTIQRDSLTHKGIVDRRAAYLAGTSRSVGRGQTYGLLPTRINLIGGRTGIAQTHRVSVMEVPQVSLGGPFLTISSCIVV